MKRYGAALLIVALAAIVLACGVAGLRGGWLVDYDYPGDVRDMASTAGRDSEEVRGFAKRTASSLLQGLGVTEPDPGDRPLQAAYCYEYLAESSYGLPEDWAEVEKYARQAVDEATTQETRTWATIELAVAQAGLGRAEEARRTASQAVAFGPTHAERAEIGRTVREGIAEATKPREGRRSPFSGN